MKVKGNGKPCAHRSNKENNNCPTPYSATMQVIEKFGYGNLTGRILEPAVGKNFAIAKVLLNYYNKNRLIFQEKELIKNPLYEYKQQDFLKMLPEEKQNFNNAEYLCEWQLCNPPFQYWDKWINMSRRVCSQGFILIGKLQFLTGINRYENNLYYSGNYNLKTVYNFIRQVDWDMPLRTDGKYKCGMLHIAVYYFKRGYQGKAEIDFINNDPYIL
jgi:hypothetical protein